MGRKKTSRHLNVYLNNVLIGHLVKDSDLSFQYDQTWIDQGFAISSSLPLQEQAIKGAPITRFLDNLLPDNEELKKTVATKFGAESIRPFDMLNVIGRDCVGALSFIPEGLTPKEEVTIQSRPLSEKEIANRLRGLNSSSPLGMKDQDFRISLAGAQEKTAFLKLEGKWHEPIGLTPTTHILKRPIGAMGYDISFDDSVDNEYFCLHLLKAFNLKACHAEIEHFEDQRVLVVERFDRLWQEDKLIRIPQEDFCQALSVSPYQKYQSEGGPGIVDIANFLRASTNADDRRDFFKLMLLFDLLWATDGHAKNFSLALRPSGFKLTPFYDIMSGYFLHSKQGHALEKLKLAMKVGNSGHYAFKRITPKHYLESAKKCGLSKEIYEEILHEFTQQYKAYRFNPGEYSSELNQNTVEVILEGMKKRFKIWDGR